MDKNDIIDYVMHTPHNTNRAVLSGMLNQLTEGGGGGSSDFSTAEVTFKSTSGTYEISITGVDEEYGLYGLVNNAVAAGGGEGTVTLTVPLCKGYYSLPTESFTRLTSTPTVTGGLQYDQYGLLITGDGTFTAAGQTATGQ